MTDSTLFRQTVQYIGEYLEIDAFHLKMDSRLTSAVEGLDSLKMFEMILYLEDRFKVEFDVSVIDKIDTMGDLVNYIKSLQAEQLHMI